MSTLLVSSVGGHLADLYRLLPRMEELDEERVWVTFDTPQSRSLLADEKVVYVDYTGPRDIKNVLRHSLLASHLLRKRHPFTRVVSAGSGIALSFLPLARMRGAECHYIECSARSVGPSTTGRLLRRVPGISLYAQYPGWAQPPWVYSGSVLDTFAPGPSSPGECTIRRAVVTVGTMQDYSFKRLIERAHAILPADAEVLWQVGCTDVSDMPIEAHEQLPVRVLQQAIEEADVVIAHAGCGSSVSALEAGKKPVLVPRLASHGENVDDHQLLIASELAERELALMRSVEELTMADLLLAARSSVRTESEPPPFRLAPSQAV
ncbi:MAG TPA: glycosyltransferase [Solirubrobacteraceae bacterium]|jgi:UDP-N-acetylglucosamine--N-acetylmuramyl-(pentapeptide) pyrophosphoryl-undecaprenol N-acetylglucosamine transferase|nr:glycosyltransferase [Solirubrobacteraceae bacterium]